MPYEIVHCVKQQESGKHVKCHDSHDAARAHLGALYANVNDADGDNGSTGEGGGDGGGEMGMAYKKRDEGRAKDGGYNPNNFDYTHVVPQPLASPVGALTQADLQMAIERIHAELLGD